MRVGLAQINTTVGDLGGNVDKCLAAIETAIEQKAGLIVLPEMAIPGYPPRDILFDPSFVAAIQAATTDLADLTQDGPPIIVGTVVPADYQLPQHPGLYNAAILLHEGKAQTLAAKQLLPTYDVFHEPRWFVSGPALPPLTLAGKKVGGLVCEDMWDEGYGIHPPADLLEAGADLLVCISASPFRQRVLEQRLYHARRPGCPLIYVNLCGATDELIFDGRSFVLDGRGNLMAQLAGFSADVQVVDLDIPAKQPSVDDSPPPQPSYLGRHSPTSGKEYLSSPPPWGERWGVRGTCHALTLGIHDFAHKNRLDHAFVGLSGGIDSAVVAILAAEALGPEHVTAIAIPSRYTDLRSTEDAKTLADNLGIKFKIVELESLHLAAEDLLADHLAQGTTAENIQARLRTVILMSFVNRYGGLLLNTSNKTELSLGYATIYGDMAGTLCPIADLTKPEVIRLAQWINANQPDTIPPFILERPPSAELRPEQVDPFDYEQVGPAMAQLVQENRSNAALRRSEYKRWQMGIILKVSEKAFGSGRLIPITRR